MSIIKNLLKFSDQSIIENHVIHAVNKDIIPVYEQEHIEGASSQQLYYYSPESNFYYTASALSRFLPDEDAVLVAHDWIELGMVSNLGLQNPVVQVLHGNHAYYYELAQIHAGVIDSFIAVSPVIEKHLREKLHNRASDINYLRFPVPDFDFHKKETGPELRIIFYAGDLEDDNKQFGTVIKIAELLHRNKLSFRFSIAGGGMTPLRFKELWPLALQEHTYFSGHVSDDEIQRLLLESDLFLLPSKAEGFPVSLVESMKLGVVPLVSHWDGAADELVQEGITGYQFNIGDANAYAGIISKLNADRDLLKVLSGNSIQRARELFDPVINTSRYDDVFITCKKKRIKNPLKVYGSRLDQPWIPNFIVELLRRSKRKV